MAKKIELNQKRTDGGYDILHPVTSVEYVIGAETTAGAKEKADVAEKNAKGHANGLVGDLNQLQTGNKSNLVSAMNETFQSGVDAKRRVVAELNAKKIPATENDTWATLASKIGQIKTEIKTANGNISGSWNEAEIRDIGFEPLIVFVRARLHVRGSDYWISTDGNFHFYKMSNDTSVSVNLDSYIKREIYSYGYCNLDWLPNGFNLRAYYNYGDHEQKSISLSSWRAFGI